MELRCGWYNKYHMFWRKVGREVKIGENEEENECINDKMNDEMHQNSNRDL